MKTSDWVETEIAALHKRSSALPATVVEILSEELRNKLPKADLTPKEETTLAKKLLAGLRGPTGVENADQ